MTRDRLLSALAGFVAVPTLLDFASWAGPAMMTLMQILAVTAPVAVAAPTGSMAPTVDGGDRLVHDSGVGDVESGDVIIYDAPGSPPTAHRAQFHVSEGENWYDRANPRYVGDASSCAELRNCPAPHAGWVTRGDANPQYDQAAGRTPPVQREWVRGRVVLVVDDRTWEFTRLDA